MSCIVNTVNFCFIEQESKILPLLFFEENVQADGFKYILKGKYNNLEYTFEVADGQGDGIGFVNDTTVQIKANFETLQEGVYTHELTWTHNGFTKVVFQGTVSIINSGTGCGCGGDTPQNFNINLQNVTQNIYIGNTDMDALYITPEWRTKNVRKTTLKRFIHGIDDMGEYIPEFDEAPDKWNMPARVQKLDLTFENYSSIVGKNPVLIIEKYVTSKSKNGNVRRARFIKSAQRINEIPITSKTMQDIYFEQETFFKCLDAAQKYVRTRGARRNMSQSGHQLFQFRVRTSEGISEPLLRIKLQAGMHKVSDFYPNGLDNDPYYENFDYFCSISYRIV